MRQDEIQLLAQLINAMDDAVRKLEEYYKKKDIENFNKYKKVVLEFQLKIQKLID